MPRHTQVAGTWSLLDVTYVTLHALCRMCVPVLEYFSRIRCVGRLRRLKALKVLQALILLHSPPNGACRHTHPQCVEVPMLCPLAQRCVFLSKKCCPRMEGKCSHFNLRFCDYCESCFLRSVGHFPFVH